jgi:hypothetical protein
LLWLLMMLQGESHLMSAAAIAGRRVEGVQHVTLEAVSGAMLKFWREKEVGMYGGCEEGRI